MVDTKTKEMIVFKILRVFFIFCVAINLAFLSACDSPIKSTEISKSLPSKKKPDLKAIFEKKDIVVTDTIKIKNHEFSKKIVFTEEVLRWGCEDVEIECSIDANEFLKHLEQDVFDVYDERLVYEGKVMTKEELENSLVKLRTFLKDHLTKKDSYRVKCVDPKYADQPKKILDNHNIAIQRKLLWSYFYDSMKEGKVNFYHKNLNQYCEEIYVVVEEDDYSVKTSYYLDLVDEVYYSRERIKEGNTKLLDAEKVEVK